ncbi:hypothetical protein [Embleya sp. NPDC001921]
MTTTHRYWARSSDGRTHEVRLNRLTYDVFVECDACGTRRAVYRVTPRQAAARHLAEAHAAFDRPGGKRTAGWYSGIFWRLLGSA